MKKKLLSILLALTIAAPLSFVATPSTSAVTGTDFNAGRIIDDAVFYNKSSMSVAQIQQFLNSKVPNCDRDGTKPSEHGGGTRAQYGTAHGAPPPYTCLKDYYENTETKENNLEGRPVPSGAKSAAQIIWDAAQEYDINPQALIVLLQKEQGLVLDEWPFPVQYRKATGYACPDTAPCDSQYFGFYNQVTSAAWQFRRYHNFPNNYNHVPGRVNLVRWSPNVSCGTSEVFIANQATASLYNYTPYRPNQAALDNLYGTGDGCSAYGNRNFWRTFSDWFGSTTLDFKWAAGDYHIFNSTETKRVDPGNLHPGETYVVKLHAYNTGSSTWQKGGPTPMMLGLVNGSSSVFCNSTWFACNRPADLLEQSVPPGGLGHFKFRIKAPFTPGSYREDFKPVAEMLSWTNNSSPNQTLGVVVKKPGEFKWTSTGYHIFNSTETKRVDPGDLRPNTVYIAKLHAYNTGTATWKRNSPTPMVLGLVNGNSSVFCHSSWPACNRPVYLQETSVAPGQLGHFKFFFKTPNTPGSYREDFKPVAEMLSWTNDSLPHQTLGIIVK